MALSSYREVFREQAFARVWTSLALASVADRFLLVILPWLVLSLTGSGLALGGVLMLAALPRAALMLAGGALSDRVAPRRVLLIANALRALLLAAIAGLVATGQAQPWQLYPFAVALGVIDAFAQPAAFAIVPAHVSTEQLAVANSLVQATTPLTAVLASAPAGALIAAVGMGPALAVTAAASALAGLPLWAPRRFVAAEHVERRDRRGAASVPGGIRPVLRAAWRDPGLRAFLILVTAASAATTGPIAVGVPALAQDRFGGSVGLGVLMSAAGLGALIGTLVAGRFGGLRHRGIALLVVNAAVAVMLVVLDAAATLVLAAAVLAVMSLAAGFVTVISTASLQAFVDRAALGRVMSLLVLASIGLAPVSYLAAGVVLEAYARALFPAAGGLLLAVTAYAARSRALRGID